MNYAQPLYMFNADACAEEEILRFGEQWTQVIDDPRRGDGLGFANQKIHEELIDVYQQLGMA